MYTLISGHKHTPVVVIENDENSIKVLNLDGFSRWIKKTDFILKNNLIILRSVHGSLS